VAQTRQGPGFALESGAERFIIGKKSSFQSDGAAEPLVNRQIDFAHSAFADELNY
jgi:hypothetical protein